MISQLHFERTTSVASSREHSLLLFSSRLSVRRERNIRIEGQNREMRVRIAQLETRVANSEALRMIALANNAAAKD